MTNTPLSTTPSSGAGRSPEEAYRVVRKRNRVPLSCYPCRSRKKCDRNHPCGNCVRRVGADTTSCSYAAPLSRRKSQAQGSPNPDDMQNRIDKLESLVLSLMHGGVSVESSTAAGLPENPSTVGSGSSATRVDDMEEDGTMKDGTADDSDVEDGLVTSLGTLRVDADRGRSLYIGQEHWHSLLANISEVKNYWSAHKKDLEKSYEEVLLNKPVMSREGPTFLLKASPASEVELRAELPPKTTVLALCRRYFTSMDHAVNIIHAPTFHEQLRKHWNDPSSSSIMWLGMLYSVLCLAMLSYHKIGDEPAEWKGRSLELASEYRFRTVQCLVTGDYTKPSDYTVETMMLYLFGEYSSRWDADLGLWLIQSMATRVAFRMGYHRDGKWFSNITPFQAEMRRRTWALIRMSDIVFSHQVCLPSMINDDDCDTELPLNILDEEFGPESKPLPPSRPASDPTPISYMTSKAKLCIELGNVLQATSRVKNQAHYDEILHLDARLDKVRAELPPHLQTHSPEPGNEPLTLVTARYNIDILYLKIVCLLHRRYISIARRNQRYAHSRRRAIEASTTALGHLAAMHRESRPGGRLASIMWYVTSIAIKDFVLPAMLVLLELHLDSAEPAGQEGPEHQPPSMWSREQRAQMISSLETAAGIWKGLSHVSMEAVKASRMVDLILSKVKEPEAEREVASREPGQEPAQKVLRTSAYTTTRTDRLRPEHAAAETLGMLSGGMTPNAATALDAISSPLNHTFLGEAGVGMSGMFETGGSGFSPNPLTDAWGLENFAGSSPTSLLDNMANNNMDMTAANFNWEVFENYTQGGNWGMDQSFQFFSGSPDAEQPQGQQQ